MLVSRYKNGDNLAVISVFYRKGELENEKQ